MICYSLCVIAQVSTHELPYSFNKDVASTLNKKTIDLKIMPEWDLTLLNTLTGDIFYKEHIIDSFVRVNTATWPYGVYTIIAQIGNKTVSKKIVIK